MHRARAEMDLVVVVPFERMTTVIPRELSGMHGKFRGQNCTFGQDVDDYSAVLVWLNECDTHATFCAYRKESERLLLWAIFQRGKPLSSLDPHDIRAYVEFLHAPFPASRWIGQRRIRDDSNWKPFAGPLSQNSIAHAVTVLSAMFHFFKEQGYVAFNPVQFFLRSANQLDLNRVVRDRFLDECEWNMVTSICERLEDFYGWHPASAQRIRFIVNFVYATGLRLSEMATAKLGDLRRDSRGRWGLVVSGGAGRARGLVCVPPLAIQDLKGYLMHRGISTTPQKWKKSTHLVGCLNGREGPAVSTQRIGVIVRNFFKLVASNFEATHPDFAEKVQRVTLHWMRHTHASVGLTGGASPASVRDNLRHASMQTMSRYFRSNDSIRADEISRAFK